MRMRMLMVWLLVVSLALPAGAQLKEAEQMYNQHNYAEALELYRKAMTKEPSGTIRLQILNTLIKLKRWDEFIKELESGLKTVPDPLLRARMLHLGAKTYQLMPHQGYKREGRVYRSEEHREGDYVWLYEEDRKQAQSYFLAARKIYEEQLKQAKSQNLHREIIAFNLELSTFWLEQFYIPYEVKDWPKLTTLTNYPYAWKDDASALEKVWQLYQENVWLARQLKDTHLEASERYRWAHILLERRGFEVKDYPDQDPLNLLQAIIRDFPNDSLVPEIRLLIGDVYNARENHASALESWQMLLSTKLKEHAEARIQELTWPQLTLTTPGAQPPNSVPRFTIQGRNLEPVRFELRSVPLEQILQNPLNLYKPGRSFKDYVQNLGGSFQEFREVTQKVSEWDWTPQPGKPYGSFAQELSLPKALPAGAYLLEAHTSKVRAALLLVLSDVVLSSRQDNQQSIYFLADAMTGKPVSDAKLYIKETTGYNSNQEVRAYRAQTDSEGMYSFQSQSVRKNENRQYEAFAAWRNPSGEAHYALSNMGYWSGYQQEYQGWRLYGYTDRPLYRPGQTVNFRQMLRRYNDGKYENITNGAVEVIVNNPRGEEVYRKTLKPNRFGSLSGSLELPVNAPLGAYHFQFRQIDSNVGLQATGATTFQVEEYKKPEYEVKVTPQPALPGETAKVTIQGEYFFGGPVAGAQVQYKVSRSNYYPYYGWDEYAYWGERNYNYNEQVVLQQTGTLDAQGKLEISFPTQANADSVYTVSAQVTDASRREVSSSGSLTVTRQAFFAQIKLNQGFYQGNDRVSAEIALRDPNSQPVPNQAGTVTVEKILAQDSSKSELKTEVVETQTVKSNAQGRIFFNWNAPGSGGKFRLRFTARDKREQVVESVQEFWVAGDGFPGQSIRLNGVELITDKRIYSPGEKVEVLVQADKPDSHVWLTRESDDAILHSQLLSLRGRSQVIDFTLSDEHQPNFMLRALTVSDRKLHNTEHELFVPAIQHRLQIGLTPDKPSYEPGSKGKLRIEVKDYQGRPVETELSLAMVDAALYQLLPDSTQPIHDALYGQRRSIPQRLDTSLNVGYSAFVDYLIKQKQFKLDYDPFTTMPGQPQRRDRYQKTDGEMPRPSAAIAEAAAPADDLRLEKSVSNLADGNVRQEAAPPRVRSEFKDTAYWNPAVTTDGNGRAELNLDFPDNLTTWRMVSRGWSTGSLVGQGQTDVRTRQDLMLRLQHPRFLTERDEVVISANVNNETDVADTVTVKLNVDPTRLKPSDALERKISVPAHGQTRVDWRMQVVSPGEAVLTAEARGSKAGDAVRQSLPVQIYGALRTETKSASTKANATVNLNLPAARKPEQTSLQITLQPSLAATLLDALPYLAEFPYGCIEQTTSRFVPAVLVSKTLQDLNINLDDLGKQLDVSAKATRIKQPLASRAQLNEMIAEGLKRLTTGQNPDGGWGWWAGGQSDEYMSTYVLDALLLARESDLKLDTAMLDKGLNFVGQAFKKQDSLHLKAYQGYVLARAKRVSVNELKGLFDQRDGLNSYSMALLAMAHQYAGAPDQAKLILQNLKSFVRRDAGTSTASWDNASPWWYWYGDRVETNAVILQAFNLIAPTDALVPEIMRWLVHNREGNRWHSTKDTARAIYALSGYLRNSRELKADYSVAVKLNGKTLQTVKFTPDQALSGPVTLTLADKDLKVGDNQIELVKTGEGTLYFSTALKVFSREDKIPAAGNRLEVKRSYYKVVDTLNPSTQKLETARTPLGEGAMLTSGEEVEVRLEVKAPNDYEYLLFEDFKPAGFETVDTLSGYVYQNGTGIYRELRDNRVAMFMGWMRQGTQVLTYRLRAEVPGIFHALPHRAEAMYAPAIQATSDSMTLKIQDK